VTRLPAAFTGRADIHVLFDADLVRIHPETLQVEVDPSLTGTEYWVFHKRPLHERADGGRPNREYLQKRWDKAAQRDKR
jgi:hypothetical protein